MHMQLRPCVQRAGSRDLLAHVLRSSYAARVRNLYKVACHAQPGRAMLHVPEIDFLQLMPKVFSQTLDPIRADGINTPCAGTDITDVDLPQQADVQSSTQLYHSVDQCQLQAEACWAPHVTHPVLSVAQQRGHH